MGHRPHGALGWADHGQPSRPLPTTTMVSAPFLSSVLLSFPSKFPFLFLPFPSLPPPPGHCFRAPATCTHGHCLRAPATCTVRDTVANGTCHRDTRGLSRACGALPSGGGLVQAQGRTMQNGVPLSRRQGYPRGTPVARTGVPRFGTFNGNHCRNTGKELGGPFANTGTRANGGFRNPNT